MIFSFLDYAFTNRYENKRCGIFYKWLSGQIIYHHADMAFWSHRKWLSFLLDKEVADEILNLFVLIYSDYLQSEFDLCKDPEGLV